MIQSRESASIQFGCILKDAREAFAEDMASGFSPSFLSIWIVMMAKFSPNAISKR